MIIWIHDNTFSIYQSKLLQIPIRPKPHLLVCISAQINLTVRGLSMHHQRGPQPSAEKLIAVKNWKYLIVEVFSSELGSLPSCRPHLTVFFLLFIGYTWCSFLWPCPFHYKTAKRKKIFYSFLA